MAFVTITVRNNYEHLTYWTPGGRELFADNKLPTLRRFLWPDGHTSEDLVRFVRTERSYFDHGSMPSSPNIAVNWIPFIELHFRGLVVEVPVRLLKIWVDEE